MKELLIGFDQEFDAHCTKLAEIDGGTFVTRNVEEDLVMELAAVANAARYTFMKFRLVQHKLQEQAAQQVNLDIKKDFQKGS